MRALRPNEEGRIAIVTNAGRTAVDAGHDNQTALCHHPIPSLLFARPVEWEWKLTPTSYGKKTITIDVSANIQIGADKHQVQVTTLHESIEIQVTTFQRLKTYVTSASGMMTAVAAAFTSLAGVLGVVPKTRQFFKDYVFTFF
ncbi:hypothetical protein ACU4GH_01835 [Bradyrhizobium betae]